MIATGQIVAKVHVVIDADSVVLNNGDAWKLNQGSLLPVGRLS